MTATLTPPTVDLPAGLRTLAVLHLAEVSGPSRTLRPRLERLAGHGAVEVVVPGPGGAAESYRDIARITTLDYRPLSFPGAAGDLAAIAGRLARETRTFRRHLRETQPDLVVIATATLPSALVAARLERLPVIVKLAEIFDKGHVQSPVRAIAGQATLALHQSLADALVCSSKAVAAQLKGSGRARVLALYPGISPDHADGDEGAFRAAYGLEDADPLIAVVGNIAAGRGQDLVVRALRPPAQPLPTGCPRAGRRAPPERARPPVLSGSDIAGRRSRAIESRGPCGLRGPCGRCVRRRGRGGEPRPLQ